MNKKTKEGIFNSGFIKTLHTFFFLTKYRTQKQKIIIIINII